ncbi:MAG: NADH-quinone oxidoreductase subunit J [Bacteroidia bacterium]|nr:NADH-quinone oxidoreductase subunit J [Bacteroidia bacterium]MCF8425661.1 NADH-quinone oxidoreductase subunit J [Bacteroidia bacterium]
MDASTILFYTIAAYILVTGVLAVTTRKIFRSAIWLLFSLIGIAALYFWMDLPFIAAVQIVVYVGGIVVLIIFSIFLTQKSGDQMPKPILGRTLPSALASFFGFVFTINLIWHHGFIENKGILFDPTVDSIGMQLLNTGEGGYILPFEVVSMLLLAAMVGCIVIAMKVKKEETI